MKCTLNKFNCDSSYLASTPKICNTLTEQNATFFESVIQSLSCNSAKSSKDVPFHFILLTCISGRVVVKLIYNI